MDRGRGLKTRSRSYLAGQLISPYSQPPWLWFCPIRSLTFPLPVPFLIASSVYLAANKLWRS